MTDLPAAPPRAAADAEASGAPTPYDRIAYPSGLFARIDPDRLAVIARLHGIDIPPTPTARVLEIGGGDGLNLTGFAAAFPQARCLSFDLAGSAVARGQALAAAAGIDNIRIERLDVLDAAETLAGDYDYVIAHGLYAWVPPAVQAATFRLIGRVLAPNGVAMVSYNALPGGLLSQTLRAMVDAALGDEPAGEARVAKSIALLRAYAEERSDGDEPMVTALRTRARLLLMRPASVLAHDEFGACFAPQTFAAVCAAAADAGLAYLNDAVHEPFEQGFPGEVGDEAALLRAIQADDYRIAATFRHSLFVRAGQPIARRVEPARAAGLWLASNARMIDKGRFQVRGETFELGDERMCVILSGAERRFPEQLSLAGMDAERIEAFVRLFLGQAVRLGTVAVRAGGVSATPRLSPLARAQIERGETQVAALDQTTAVLSPELARLLLLLDGSRDAEALAAAAGIGVAEAMTLIGLAAQSALLVP